MNWEQIKQEVQMRTARSGGSGGQHVNKVETKVSLRFAPADSHGLTEREKTLLQERLAGQFLADGTLGVSCESERSQLRNRKMAYAKLRHLLEKALEKRPKRKGHQARIDKAARRAAKEQRSEKKALRRKIRPQDL
jgi:ribosome-associated protein